MSCGLLCVKIGLNHLMLLAIHKEETEKLDIDYIGDEFVRGSELHRLSSSCAVNIHCVVNNNYN